MKPRRAWHNKAAMKRRTPKSLFGVRRFIAALSPLSN
jgi:hypothetical protein